MTTAILAIDLGKFNSVLCWYEPATKATEFRTIKTTPELLRKELTRQPVAKVVFEAGRKSRSHPDDRAACVERSDTPVSLTLS